MSPLPQRHPPYAGNPGAHHRGQGRARRSGPAGGAGRHHPADRYVRPGPDRTQPGAVHPEIFPGRVRGPYLRQALQRGRVRGASDLALPQRVSGQCVYPRLHVPAGRRPHRRRLPPDPPGQSVPGCVRPRLHTPLRVPLPPGAGGRTAGDLFPQALYRRLRAAGRVQYPAGGAPGIHRQEGVRDRSGSLRPDLRLLPGEPGP